jgi:hypothetical protein
VTDSQSFGAPNSSDGGTRSSVCVEDLSNSSVQLLQREVEGHGIVLFALVGSHFSARPYGLSLNRAKSTFE